MGTCWNCNTEVALEGDRTHCDECGRIIYYICHACKHEFPIEDKKTKKKLKECKLCGYFLCPNCGICSDTCIKHDWKKEILKILKPEIHPGKFPNLMKKIEKIINYMEEEKGGKEQKVCPERGVLISYAKNRIKSLLAKFEGYKVKNIEDRNAFLSRVDEVTNKPLGTELKISDAREKGTYGQEYRDAFNLSVCLGKLKIEKREFTNKSNETISYEVYKRVEQGKCPYLDKENLVINTCTNPKHKGKNRFPLDKEDCPTCPLKKSKKNKGQPWKLKKRLNDKDTCQMYRGDFIKKQNG